MAAWLYYSFELILRMVKKKERVEFEIFWPRLQEMKASSSLWQDNRNSVPLLNVFFAVTDGDRMPCAIYIDSDFQNA